MTLNVITFVVRNISFSGIFIFPDLSLSFKFHIKILDSWYILVKHYGITELLD